MIIEVTQKDIEDGIKYDCNYCPVALAIKREYKKKHADLSNVIVGEGMISIALEGGKLLSAHMSNPVRSWICHFDNGRKVQPFTAEIDLIPL